MQWHDSAVVFGRGWRASVIPAADGAARTFRGRKGGETTISPIPRIAIRLTRGKC